MSLGEFIITVLFSTWGKAVVAGLIGIPVALPLFFRRKIGSRLTRALTYGLGAAAFSVYLYHSVAMPWLNSKFHDQILEAQVNEWIKMADPIHAKKSATPPDDLVFQFEYERGDVPKQYASLQLDGLFVMSTHWEPEVYARWYRSLSPWERATRLREATNVLAKADVYFNFKPLDDPAQVMLFVLFDSTSLTLDKFIDGMGRIDTAFILIDNEMNRQVNSRGE